ncbi:MAG: phospholipase D-like domain-containing protein [Bryobacteraceae bacterium]
MRLLTQPNDGVMPIVKSITGAKKSVEIMIFRFDRREVEAALASAVTRGVSVTALIAHTNKAGEERLRRLEMRLLAAGVTVSRTADDFIRYHGKMMIIDRRELQVLAFNFTTLDIDRSRSFGFVTRSRRVVSEAASLFEADMKRHPYEARCPGLIVSPSNARKELSAFIKGATKSLLIYDVEVSDPDMVRLIEAKAKAGVDVRLIGGTRKKKVGFETRECPRRLHTRTMIRDGRIAFIGSQSLRQIELDRRREVGILIRDRKIAAAICKTFEADWAQASEMQQQAKGDSSVPTEKAAKRVAKAVTKGLPGMTPVLEQAIKEISKVNEIAVSVKELEEDVRDAIKEAVKSVVTEAVESANEDRADAGT